MCVVCDALQCRFGPFYHGFASDLISFAAIQDRLFPSWFCITDMWDGIGSWFNIWRDLLAVRVSWLSSCRADSWWGIDSSTLPLHLSSNQPLSPHLCREENMKSWIGSIREKTLPTHINRVALFLLSHGPPFRRIRVGLHNSANAICVIHQTSGI